MPITQIDESYRNLDVVVYSEPEPISKTLSKCRVRIFYRGLNRNRTFISDDFAQQLINSLPYTPVKGIFNYGKVDYEDHGCDNTDGRIYGIIAAEPNFAWEKHIDEDGIEREYACADAILFSALYPEAKIIVGSKQSMEIYADTMEGYWDTWEDGMPCFYFKKGELLGLQVLGQDVEPCFEGAAFYSLAKEIKELADYVKSFKEQEEKKKMENTNIEEVTATPEVEAPTVVEQTETATVEQAEATTEETTVEQPEVATAETPEVPTEHSVVENVEPTAESEVEDVFEQKKKEDEGTPVDDEDVSDDKDNVPDDEEEKKKAKNELDETLSSLRAEIEELKAFKSQYQSEFEALKDEKVRLDNELKDIKDENTELKEFKLGVENAKKEDILNKFEEMLSDEQYTSFKDSVSKYTEEDFEKEIIATIYRTNPNAFTKKEPELIYKDSNKDVVTESGMIGLLNRHKNGGNR